ncbi:MAG TPA: polysaccharide deacetylase family protein [Candidatus Avacidaminococcus intestinavium]|uniref:Polysaccharide deacetylase family protein n=1 Tax=Candidatus Avacidaminococcus intestinavium TaxID=2840684 RepID=A0A9D1SL92_9FIRM|nr:polysaccharide deacetylase family protein [Candidatus Avacidaminococcus intestinavium]
MYHRIADIPGDRNSLPLAKFEEQLQFLAANGYQTITLDDVYDYYTNNKSLPPKTVVLTFDDGYKDNLTLALPLLIKYNMQATVFAITDWVGKENKWENFNKKLTTTMDWSELKKWQTAGMQVGSHTVSHPFLAHLEPTMLKQELQKSKKELEERLAVPIDHLCYPYGNFNKNVCIASKDAGYKTALAIFEHAPLWQIDLFALPRIPIPAKQKMWEFKLKVSPIHTIFIFLRQAERAFKKLFK